MKDLVRVSEIEGKTPFSKMTFYKWAHEGRHSEIFVRLGQRNLFVDLSKLDELMKRETSEGRKGNEHLS